MKNKTTVIFGLLSFIFIFLGLEVSYVNAGGLGAPTIQKADVLDRGVVLTWQSPAGNESGFLIERGKDGINFTPIAIGFEGKTYNPKVQYFRDIYGWYGLESNTQYYYRMRVYKTTKNSSNYSPYSNVMGVKTW
jgi:hypothetical protein